MKIKILAAILLFAAAAQVHAASGPERNVTADPVFSDYGNTWREIRVEISTSHVVLISSAPENAVSRSSPTVPGNLGITTWRYREIVNLSTCSAMSVYSSPEFDQFSSTIGVLLSSGAAWALGAGDSWTVPSQDEVWAIWSDNRPCSNAGAGAGGVESYYLLNKKR